VPTMSPYVTFRTEVCSIIFMKNIPWRIDISEITLKRAAAIIMRGNGKKKLDLWIYGSV